MLQMLESEPYFSIVMKMAQSAQLPTLQRIFLNRNETTARYRKKHYQLLLRKFHHFLYKRKLVLVTDHKPLLSLFGPQLAANRLARWALMLSQYEYTAEYRKTSDHGNADVLSRLPAGPDSCFDGEESKADTDCICLLYTSPSPRDLSTSRMPSSA